MIDLAPLFGPRDGPGRAASFRVFPRKGPERWLLETRYRRPWHLETWPLANLRAKLIYRSARAMGVLGLQLPSRRIELRIAEGSAYDRFQARFDALGVFLGTPGPNRKIVVYARKDDRGWFLKLPVSHETRTLAQAEAAALEAVGADPDLARRVPKHFWIGDALAVEDVRRHGTGFGQLADREVLRVHDLLFARSRTRVALDEIIGLWTAPPPATAPLCDGIAAARIASARTAAQAFRAALHADAAVEAYMAHGDFTRWNVLRARDGTARIIDWELFGLRPKFFDPFHYLVSQAVLIDRKPAGEILARAERLAAKELDKPASALYLGAYVACQVFYYAGVFERQAVLHPQAHWQLDTWTDLLHRLAAAARGAPGRSQAPGLTG